MTSRRRLPGTWLLRAGGVLGPRSREHVVEPLVADLQAEWLRAVEDGAPWRARLVRLRWAVAFGLAVPLQGLASLGSGLRQSWADDSGWLGAGVRSALLRVLAVAGLATAYAIFDVSQRLRPPLADGSILPFQLLPALAVGLPMGCLIAGAFPGLGLGVVGRRSALRGAVLVSVLTLSLMAWLVPRSNQAYREHAADRLGISVGPGSAGDREMTLGQLVTFLREPGRASGGARRGALVELHKRLAMPVWCVSLALVGVALSRWIRWIPGRLVLGCAVLALVYGSLRLGERLADAGRLRPELAIWGPILVVTAVALASGRAGSGERVAVTRHGG